MIGGDRATARRNNYFRCRAVVSADQLDGQLIGRRPHIHVQSVVSRGIYLIGVVKFHAGVAQAEIRFHRAAARVGDRVISHAAHAAPARIPADAGMIRVGAAAVIHRKHTARRVGRRRRVVRRIVNRR